MKALIIVDVQVDFCPKGALEVKDGNSIIPGINQIQGNFDLVVATQDWHPKDHQSFASNNEGMNVFETIDLHGQEQVLWPDHCVQGTKGAEIHPDLDTGPIEAIFRKGMDPEIDSYSGFYDNGQRKNTGLSGYLKDRNVSEVHVCGLAGDYCVYYTSKDAFNEGFRTFLIEDLTRSIDPQNFSEIKNHLAEMGVQIINSQ